MHSSDHHHKYRSIFSINLLLNNNRHSRPDLLAVVSSMLISKGKMKEENETQIQIQIQSINVKKDY